MSDLKFYKVTWSELEQDCIDLSKKIKKIDFDRILCISRGGLVWARMFSDLLKLPVSHLTATSYTGIHEQKDVKITELPAQEHLENQTLLVVDEIADHGKTFKAISDHLKTVKIKKFYTLAPIIRTYTNPKPDFYLKVIDEWIVYPYELRETYEAFIKIFGKEVAIKKMEEVGFSTSDISGLI